MKSKKRMLIVLIALMLCMVSAAASAHETPDGGKKGTIIVEMKYGGEAVKSGTLTAYRIGQIQERNGDYVFVKTKEMAGLEASYDDIGSAALAEEAAQYVKEKHVTAAASAENKVGKVVFKDLELGLYLIVQTEASEGYEPVKPFLMAVPANEEGHYLYQVTAEGKFELQKEPAPPEPTPPEDPKLPQTGQLNWPVPALAVLGMILLTAGWSLRASGRKSCCNQK